MSLSRRLIAASGAGAYPTLLKPGSTLAVTRSGVNPTFDFGSLVENVLEVDGTFWACYCPATSSDIRLASSASADGPWTEYPGNPMIVGSDALYSPHLLLDDDGTFYLYYSVDQTSGAGIAVATASAVTGPYTKTGIWLLEPGASGQWDDFRVGEPFVVKDGATYVMFYMGERSPTGTSEKIGVATASTAAGPFTRVAGNPVLDHGGVGTWDAAIVADPALFKVAGRWWMLYSASPTGMTANDAMGLAYADVLIGGTWTKFAGNPILAGSGSGFEMDGVLRGAICVIGGRYKLTYTGIKNSASPVYKGGNAEIVPSRV